MRFYWPAPLDLIDPSFDFILEKGQYGMRQQKHQKLPHEVFDSHVYHGILVSKAHLHKGHLRWNTSQVNRLLREGAKRFLKMELGSGMSIMGDSGAYTIDDLFERNGKLIDQCLPVFDFYSALEVDYGLAPDRVISGALSYNTADQLGEPPREWKHRWLETIDLADAFWALCKRREPRWQPVGVAQGWDAASYQACVEKLQQIGYSYIALGGLNSLKADKILECVRACGSVRHPSTSIHLLGISRIECVSEFAQFGVTSFDSAMPIRQAIKDRMDNYHGYDKNYMAIKLPQLNASPRMQRLVRENSSLMKQLLCIEQESMRILREFDKGRAEVEEVLSILRAGAELRREEDNTEEYRRLLVDTPWKSCCCSICQAMGIEIVLLRNRERNLRRSFHNLFVFASKMRQEFPSTWS